MSGRAVDAEEDTVCNGSPCRILGVTIEAHLKQKKRGKNDEIWRAKVRDLEISKQICDFPHQISKNEAVSSGRKGRESTLFSDLDLSFLKMAFLSIEISDAMASK